MRPEIGTEEEPKATWVLSPPARVRGVGNALGEILEAIRTEDVKKLPSMEKLEQIKASATNRVNVVPVDK